MNASAPPHMFPAKPQILSMSQENNQQTTNGEEKRKLHRRAVSNAGSPNAFRVNKAREQNKHKRFNSLVEFDIFSSPALSTDYRNRADSLASSITNTNGYNAYCPTEYSDYSYQNSNTLPVGFVDMAGGFSLNTSSQHGELYDHAQSNYDQQSQIFSTPQSMYPNYSEFNYNGNYEEGINIPLRCESASFEPIQYRPNSALLSEQVVDSEQTLHFRNESFDEKDESDDSEVLMCGWHGCGQSFEVNASLVKHVSDDHIGSGMASYLCQWEGCNRHMKPFAKRHKIQNHVRIHTGERPFACNLDGCPKKFSRQDGLNTHMKTHSSVRPYVCTYMNCRKAYYHSCSLRKHEKLHGITREDSPFNGDSGFIESTFKTPPTSASKSISDKFNADQARLHGSLNLESLAFESEQAYNSNSNLGFVQYVQEPQPPAFLNYNYEALAHSMASSRHSPASSYQNYQHVE